eukprot:CAMPEP_0202900998 /NCGR_PEP_ID=MMETSP1392-20130828/12646_1 /ASSEMBLY_ACC=CAM_ASM_000868 /TAXON_ID=225041 /ORGANISM="Chlamydomonas chlamydogama, Strain SAG 11-48b" /LENGTH=66 /DNA_ID=CAMNT_0049587479 /DNA_START=92 /DNA_END=292 /DNA_ORIENTATION=+
MALLRVRVTSFLVGFGVAAGFALYQLRQDVLKSHEVLKESADKYRTGLEKRIAALEAQLAEKKVQQ